MNEKCRFTPPNDEAPESWLRRYNPQPTLLPRWPPAQGTALIAVSKSDDVEADTDAVVIVAQSQLEAVLRGDDRTLYFVIPLSTLLQAGACGLTAEDFTY